MSGHRPWSEIHHKRDDKPRPFEPWKAAVHYQTARVRHDFATAPVDEGTGLCTCGENWPCPFRILSPVARRADLRRLRAEALAGQEQEPRNDPKNEEGSGHG